MPKLVQDWDLRTMLAKAGLVEGGVHDPVQAGTRV